MRPALAAHPAGPAAETSDQLTALRSQFPAFRIWQETTRDRISYVARRRHPWISLHTFMTSDPGELRAILAAEPGQAYADFPHAIADDYPGWEVAAAPGAWSASCPAMTVHATTPAGLRAAIEAAICPDDPDPL